MGVPTRSLGDQPGADTSELSLSQWAGKFSRGNTPSQAKAGKHLECGGGGCGSTVGLSPGRAGPEGGGCPMEGGNDCPRMAWLTVEASSELRPSAASGVGMWGRAASPADQAGTTALFPTTLGSPDPYLSDLCLSGQAPTLHQWLPWAHPHTKCPSGL